MWDRRNTGQDAVAPQIVDALKRLEYRGYDSAGVATLEDGGRLERRRAEGKLGNLEVKLSKAPLAGAIGIGHTRWATHGAAERGATPTRTRPRSSPSSTTASSRISASSRTSSAPRGVRFETETDTEVVAQLVTREMRKGKSPIEAVAATLPRLRGAFALAFLFAGEEDLLIGARHGAAARGRPRRGRDVSRLRRHRARPLHRRRSPISRTATGPCCRARASPIRDARRRRCERPRQRVPAGDLHGRQGQPPPFHGEGDLRAARGRRPHARPLRRLRGREGRAAGTLPFDFKALQAHLHLGLRHRLLRRADRQVLVRAPAPGCRSRSTSPPSSATASRRWSEGGWRSSSRSPARPPTRSPRCATPRRRGSTSSPSSTCQTSTMARESAAIAPTLAGTEIGVASTKAFTCQLTVLLCLAIAAGRARGTLSRDGGGRARRRAHRGCRG